MKNITTYADKKVFVSDDLIFDNRGEAETVLSQMDEIVKCYGLVTVSDLYDLVGIEGDYKTHKYGWTNISNTPVIRVIDGYILKLPEIKRLETDYAIQTEVCKVEAVNHPPHYISETGLEVIDVIQAFTFDLTGIEATDTGNIIKYACRWKNKNGVEDLKKIVWYAQHLINHIEKLEKENE